MLMQTSTPLVTADEFMRMPDPEDGCKYELVEGRLIKMPGPGMVHGLCAANILITVGVWARGSRAGVVVTEVACKLASDPDTVRLPDVGFFDRARLGSPLPRSYSEGAADLAVEVLSPSDRRGQVRHKIRDWLAHGARLVWIVDPKARTVTVHRPGAEPAVLIEEDPLDDEDVLPGFHMMVHEVFAGLD